MIKDLIPILTSFLANKNQFVSIKASELFSIIKEKILSELFEYEKDEKSLKEFLNTRSELDSKENELEEITKNLTMLIEKSNLGQNDFSLNKMNSNLSLGNSTRVESIQDINNFKFQRKTRKASSKFNDENLEKFYYNHNPINPNNINNHLKLNNKNQMELSEKDMKSLTNEVIEDEEEFNKNENNFNLNEMLKDKNEQNEEKAEQKENLNQTSNRKLQIIINSTPKITQSHPNIHLLKKKRNLFPFNNQQINILFKGFLVDEKQTVDDDKLKSAAYCDDFFKNIYSKFNGLPKRIAFKRKNVCLKLKQIFKYLVFILLILCLVTSVG